MSTALFVLAALLTALQLFDGWSTYQIVKYGGYEKNRIVARLMGKVGVYAALCLWKVLASACAWVTAFTPQILARLSYSDVRDWDWTVDYCAVVMVGLTMWFVWLAMENWQVLQYQRGKGDRP